VTKRVRYGVIALAGLVALGLSGAAVAGASGGHGGNHDKQQHSSRASHERPAGHHR
jgi:hypothetical protein